MRPHLSSRRFRESIRPCSIVKLAASERKTMAVRDLTGAEPVSALAVRYGVSRPRVYRQRDKASDVLDNLFSTAPTDDDADKVLFSLPVTRRWLAQATPGLTMAHASTRSVVEFMHDVVGASVSLGAVHNIHQQAAQQAIAMNDSVDLSAIRVGLHDEIFQGSQPVLAGIDATSTYCYLLAAEDRRDRDTWAIHLLDLRAHGLHPDLYIRLPMRARVCARVRKSPGQTRRVMAMCFTFSRSSKRWSIA